ncbi:MAG TPA: ABC transporter permease [Candidatus Acidoferrum sp.]|nr:ABC transporter permease [Candidatus Acidoferrum sp.]
MKRAAVVALNTFREAVRDRVLYNLLFFALVMMAAAILVGQISIGIEETVIKSLGLSAISVIGVLIAVFIGVGLVYKEMDKRTLYAVLAKPVRRWEFLLGKFGGLALTLTVNTAAMTLGLFATLLYVKPHLEPGDGVLLVAIYFILLKLLLVVALALLFSCYSTPLLAILYTATFYLAGQFVEEMRTFHMMKASPQLQALLRGLSYVLPNFENFNVAGAATHGQAIAGSLVLQNTVYTAVYCGVLLLIATAVFSRRNLK